MSAGSPASDNIAFVVFGGFTWAYYKSDYPGSDTSKDVFAVCLHDKLPSNIQYAPGSYALIHNKNQYDRIANTPATDAVQVILEGDALLRYMDTA